MLRIAATAAPEWCMRQATGQGASQPGLRAGSQMMLYGRHQHICCGLFCTCPVSSLALLLCRLFQAEFCGKGQPVLVTGIQSSWFRDQATLARMSKTWDKPAGGEKGRWRPLNVSKQPGAVANTCGSANLSVCALPNGDAKRFVPHPA